MTRRNIFQLALILSITMITSTSLVAQNNFFTDAGQNRIVPATGMRMIIPQKFRSSGLNVRAMKDFLWSLPSEKAAAADRNKMPVIELPMPDGSVAKFRIWESSIMEPGLEAKFPEMKTFAGQGITDPYASIRIDYNPYFGFHAQVLSALSGTYYIDPFSKGNINYYISYYKRDYAKATSFTCESVDSKIVSTQAITSACRGTELRTYRLALACTGEYAVAVCAPNAPTVSATAAAMLTSVNRVTGIYELEVSVRMVLVANNNNLIYLDGATDPYSNFSGGTMLGQNQTNIDAVIGGANYDIGHVFSTGGGGIANLNSPCNATLKARGVTGLPSPVGDAFDVDYVSHEMGHQFGGNHTMAGCGSSPNYTKYEVGSGTTIQAYAGICGVQNIQPNSDPTFHAYSFDEISNFVGAAGGSTCGTVAPTGNTLPVISPLPNNGASIPPSTPFTLSGSATDADGDALTYSWEEMDLGGGSFYNWNAGATAAAGNTVPLFKSRIPKTTGVRTFPDIAVILAGYPANPPATLNGLKGETLSPVARPMKFRLSVRDNRAGGGGVVSSGSGCQDAAVFQVNVVGTTPFTVTTPNGGESYTGLSNQTVTWDAAGTSAAPFNVANVKISLSTDGGLTYPTVISASTPNDGTESVTMPNTATTTARIKIEAIDNIFFDISNANFTILFNPCITPTINAPTLTQPTCTWPTGTIVVNATGSAALEYSVNDGANWQASATFGSLLPGNYNIKVREQATPTCAATYSGNPVVIDAVPVIAAPVITPNGATTFCGGGSVILTASAANAYLWSTGKTTQSITVTTTGNYSVTITDANGCSGTSAATTVTVNPLPEPFIQADGPTTFCTGGSVNLSAVLYSDYYLKLSSPLTNRFNIGIAVFGPPVSTTPINGDFVYIPDASASYLGCNPYTAGSLTGKVALIDRTACAFVTKVKNAQDAGAIGVIIVNNNPGIINMGDNGLGATVTIPSIFVSVEDGLILKELIAQGTVNGATFQHTYSYLWSNGAITSSINVTESGDYSVQLTDENGCVGTSGITSVTVNPIPPKPVISVTGPLSFCAGGSLTLSSSAATGNQWYKDGSILVGETAKDYIASTSGLYTVIVTLQDCSSDASAGTSVSANSAPVIIAPVSTTLTNVQYSDPIVPVTITATDDGPGSALTASTQYKLGAGSFIAGLPSNLSLVVTATGANTRSWTLSGIANLAPGTYTIRTTVSDGQCENYIDLTLTVGCENARAYYTGAMYTSTSGVTSSNATVTLSATIRDITAELGEPEYDAYGGDIRNATVTFINRDNNTIIAANVPVGLVNPGDLTVGTATYNWNTSINGDAGQFTIGIIVNNYYCRNSADDNTVITIAKPLTEYFITGGGYLLLTNSAGIKSGRTGSKNNFGFNVKFNKSGKNLQGNINTIVRKIEDGVLHVYQIKGNAMTSLAVNENCPKTATFNGKANIKDITDPLNPISIEGNATLQVKMTDMGEPGSSDKIAITVWNRDGGLWFASNWNGTATVEQTLGGGNLKIHGGAPCAPNTQPGGVITKGVLPDQGIAQPGIFQASAFPNPTHDAFTIQVVSVSNDPITVRLMDINGKVKEVSRVLTKASTIKIGAGLMGGTYFAEVTQGTNKQMLKLVKF